MTDEFETLERALVRAGREWDFPVTPAIAARVRVELTSPPTPLLVGEGRWARVLVPLAAAFILAFALLFAIPGARDAVAQFLGLRGLRIFYVTPTHTPSLPTPLPTGEGRETQIPPSSTGRGAGGEGTATPRPIATPTVKSFTLCCETTLQDAPRRAHFQLLAPPHETPSRVYYQNIFDSAEQVVMVFGDPENPRFTLYQARRWIYAKMIGKFIHAQTVLGEARVRDARALWFSGAPHIVALFDANGSIIYDTQRVVDANTLVWETGDAEMGIIYRVETRGSLEDAVRFAESLAPRQAEEP